MESKRRFAITPMSKVKEVDLMPGRDGTGPLGQGPVGGRAGMGGGRGRGNMSAGSGEYCVCPKCGEKIPHQQGTPCSSVLCPKCGMNMVRDQ